SAKVSCWLIRLLILGSGYNTMISHLGLIRTFLKPNSAEKIRWSTDEMQPDKGLEMTVALRETDAGQGVPGNFRALATFNFIYQ
ncbi:fimbrial protein, partial [Escherichia coli]|uniref:fimbrial protein n=1 Tax=Escherichia coli TaxID=562 RepID=UPI0013AF4A2A